MLPLLAPKVVLDLILGASLMAAGKGMEWVDLLQKSFAKNLEKERD